MACGNAISQSCTLQMARAAMWEGTTSFSFLAASGKTMTISLRKPLAKTLHGNYKQHCLAFTFAEGEFDVCGALAVLAGCNAAQANTLR